VPEARSTAAHAARAADAARTALGAPSGQLELATVTSMAVSILPSALARWHRQHADTTVYLHEFRHRRELHEAVRGGLGIARNRIAPSKSGGLGAELRRCNQISKLAMTADNNRDTREARGGDER